MVRRSNALLATLLLVLSGCLADPDRGPTGGPDLPGPLELLAADADAPLTWVVVHVPGKEPAQATMDAVAVALDDAVGPGAHRFAGVHGLDEPARGETHEWTADDLRLLEHRIMAEYADGPTLAVALLDGRHADEGDSVIFGIQSGRVAFVFQDRTRFLVAHIDRVGPDNPGQAIVERSVAVHEVGHVLGLVDNGVPMQRDRLPPESEDPCRCHSDNPDSVMYYQMSDQKGLEEMLLAQDGRLPYRFDPDDLLDLRTARAQALAGEP